MLLSDLAGCISETKRPHQVIAAIIKTFLYLAHVTIGCFDGSDMIIWRESAVISEFKASIKTTANAEETVKEKYSKLINMITNVQMKHY